MVEGPNGSVKRPPEMEQNRQICRPKGARSCSAWRRAAADLGLPPADLSPPAPRSLPACPRSWAKKPEIFGARPEILGKKAKISRTSARDLGQKGRDLFPEGQRSADFAPKISRRPARDLRPPTRRSRVGFGGTRPEIRAQISGRATSPSGPLLARALPRERTVSRCCVLACHDHPISCEGG